MTAYPVEASSHPARATTATSPKTANSVSTDGASRWSSPTSAQLDIHCRP